MHLTKMQGLGNDYLYVYGEVENPAELSVKWADRHFGIGSDGLILIQDSEVADFKMRIFNADGSEAKMCGNGIRCVGKFVYDKGYTSKTTLDIETLSGIRRLKLDVKDGLVQQATVEMGEAVVEDAVTLTALEQKISCVPVSVGNPHCIVFC
ncbi:MAG: diaminopimelate epimerase, partial [Ruminococcaceae bacterium]|nr:diaminopimelate epimerase [Oscillospiraceae bacterium]